MIGSVPIPIVVVMAAALVMAFIDVLQYRIYNVFTYPLLLAGLVYHGAVGGAGGLVDSLLGTLFGFAILIPLYMLGGMGGGDIKLMAAIGAWLGLLLTFFVFLASALVAGLYGLLVIVAYGRSREALANLQLVWPRAKALGRYSGEAERIETAIKQPNRGGRLIPFAAMVAFGLFVLLACVRFLGPHLVSGAVP